MSLTRNRPPRFRITAAAMLFLLPSLLLMLSGCRTTRQATTPPSPPPSAESLPPTEAEAETGAEVPAETFRTLTARADLHLDWEGEETIVPAELRIITDSVIVLSVRPIVGLEVVHIRLECERFLVIDRFHHLYAEGLYTALSSFAAVDTLPPPEPVTFHRIQQLLSEHVFLPEWQTFFGGRFAVRFSRVQTDVPLTLDMPALSAKYRRISPEEWFKSLKKP